MFFYFGFGVFVSPHWSFKVHFETKLKTVSGVIQVHAQYRQFTIQSQASNYMLAVDGYSGNAGNGFLEGSLELFGVNRTMTIHNGMMFSTYDRDNDNW